MIPSPAAASIGEPGTEYPVQPDISCLASSEVCNGRAMAFGQASGPPASGKQVRELTELLAAAGHDGFRDARGPLGLSQRQAAGKFTRDEAQAFIDQLEEAAHADEALPARATPVVRLTQGERAARALSDAELLAEVHRRGLTGSSSTA